MSHWLWSSQYDETWFQRALYAELKRLNDIVFSGTWRTDQLLTQSLIEKYYNLAQLGVDTTTFANAEFWTGATNDADLDERLSFNFNSDKKINPFESKNIINDSQEAGPSHQGAAPNHRGGNYHLIDPNLENSDSFNSDDVNIGQFDEVEEGVENNNHVLNNEISDLPPSHFYQLKEIGQNQYVRRFNTQRRRFSVSFINIDQFENIPARLEEIFDDMLRNLLQNFQPDNSTGLQINHPSLDHPIFIPLTKNSNLTGLKILNAILRVLQSKTALRIDENMEIITVSVYQPAGSGDCCVNKDGPAKKPRAKADPSKKPTAKAGPSKKPTAKAGSSKKPTGKAGPSKKPKAKKSKGGGGPSKKRLSISCNYQKWFKSHSGKGGCFLQIRNSDHLCLARAIVTAKARLEKDPQYKTIHAGDTNRNTLQRCKADALMEAAGLKEHKTACGLFQVEKIQEVLTDYQIKIFSHDARGPIFIGKEEKDDNHIISLLLKDDHYTVITSLPAFFGKNAYCNQCNKSFDHKEDHRCLFTCNACYSRPACKLVKNPILCSDCNRFFYSLTCFTKHKRKFVPKGNKKQKISTSTCERIQRCKTCSTHIRRADKEPHLCGQYKCWTCKQLVEKENHLCFMQKIAAIENDEDDVSCDQNGKNSDTMEVDDDSPIFVFYDFECSQELEIKEKVFEHVPNLCVAHIVCDNCHENLSPCHRCGEHKKIFRGTKCLEDFAAWLFSNTKKKMIAIAHNSKGYDAQFIMKYLQTNGIKPLIVNKGLELMSLSVGKIKLLDSLNFLPMALSALPKAFGIKELAKGWFPHLFNISENQQYIGAWPEMKFYCPNSMKPETRKEFETWHHQQFGKLFNFQEEILKYCDSDVDILRRCCLEFRKIFREKTNVDPFDNSLTIAGACNRVFRINFLKPNTIGLIPHGGYRNKDKASAVAIKWLKWLSYKDAKEIRHARNGKEQKIGQYKVDGICNRDVYEYNGCYWHGCPECMTFRQKRTRDSDVSAQAAYERTIQRRLL